MTEQIDAGALRLEGELRKGRLTRMVNPRAGLALQFPADRACFWVEVESDGATRRLSAADMEFRIDGEEAGSFGDPATGLVVTLAWEPHGTDAATCTLAFRLTRLSTRVTALCFETPGPVCVSTTKNDTLVYPAAGGIRIERPTCELFRDMEIESAHWKNRTLNAIASGFDLEERDGQVDFGYPYSARCSMQWMDYYGERGGIYLAAHDDGFDPAFLGVRATRGKEGLVLRVEKHFARRTGSWQGRFVLALHAGDWHRGADLYRSFFKHCHPTFRRAPVFVRRAPGLFCHYDFKWQDGSIHHRFADLPALADEARANGFTDLLVAGWNTGGFDSLYPDFKPAEALGGEAALKAAITQVQQKGCRLSLYTNAFSYDTAHPAYPQEGRQWAVKRPDQAPIIAGWGSRSLAGMCNSVPGWRQTVRDNVRYIVEELGADGVYIDQLAVSPQRCYDLNHEHTCGWIANNRSLVAEIRSALGPDLGESVFLYSEWLTDLLALELDAQLIHTCWMQGVQYAFPEMFRYTFPEVMLLDQVLQKPWPGNPATVEGAHVQAVFCREFITGLYFWTYDHVPLTPAFGEFFRNAVALRQSFADDFADGIFRDTTGLKEISPHVSAKRFELPDGGQLVAIWNRTASAGIVRLTHAVTGHLVSRDIGGVEATTKLSGEDRIPFPATPLSLHRVTNEQERQTALTRQ